MEEMEREARLLANLVNWMVSHGEVIREQTRSNAYTGVRVRSVRWHGRVYTVVEVDGMVCELKREEE